MTIHIAIPAELRRNADVAELLKKIASGEKTVTDLHEYLMKPITDEQVKHHLRASQAGEPAAREDLFTHIAEELNRLIGQVPQQALGTMQDLPVFGAWQRVITTTQHAAELLWRDFFSGFATEADARRILQPTRKRHFIRRASGVDLARLRDQADARLQRLERLTVVAHLLLLFGIEAALYQFRSTVNARARGTVPMRRSFVRRRQSNGVRSRIVSLIRAYQTTMAGWDEELVRITGRRFFRDQLGDAQRFRSLSQQFGPAGLDPREQGWAIYSADARSELRYRSLDAHRSEQIRIGRRLSGWALRLQEWTTGYGTKPGRFVRTGVIVITIFSLLFFANDYLNPGVRANARFCPGVRFSHTPPWEIVVHYLYVTVTNLTSLGSNTALAQYCGGMATELLLVASSLTGYFLLATLAALFFQQVREADN